MRNLIKHTNSLLAAYRSKNKERIAKCSLVTVNDLDRLRNKAQQRFDSDLISEIQYESAIHAIAIEESAIITQTYVQFAINDPYFHRVLGEHLTPSYLRFLTAYTHEERIR